MRNHGHTMTKCVHRVQLEIPQITHMQFGPSAQISRLVNSFIVNLEFLWYSNNTFEIVLKSMKSTIVLCTVLPHHSPRDIRVA